MPTVSIVLRTDRINKKGEAPINFFIIKNRKLTKVSTGIMVNPKFWDANKCRVKRGEKNSGRVNSHLSHKFTELQDHVLEYETSSKSLTSSQLKEKIYGKKPSDFFAFADKACEKYLEENKIGSYDKNKSIIRKLKEFCNGSSKMFQDITPDFLNQYERWCRISHSNKTNTIHKDLKFVRKIFNDAYREDLIEHNQIPFLKYKMKTEKTQRIYLTDDELTAVENFNPSPGTRLELHRDMFVFAAYAGGLRVSDVLQLRWKNFDGSHIHFVIKKTKTQLSIKLPNKAVAILNKYKPKKTESDGFIFPMLPKGINTNDPRVVDKEISGATAYINKNLKIIAAKLKLAKPLSFHISRHTWATKALRKGMAYDQATKIMGLSSIREMQVYGKIGNEALDMAMELFND